MLEVANVEFGSLEVSYYLHADGFSKATNAAPCVPFLFKAGFADEKALFNSMSVEESIGMSDALGDPGFFLCNDSARRFHDEYESMNQ